MIRKAEECLVSVTNEMRGGPGSVKITNIVEEGELNNKGRLFSRLTLEPGCGVGYHEHIGESEIFFIEEGEAVYNDNGKEYTIKAGDVAVCDPGGSHSITNKSDQVCNLIALILFE